MRTNRVSTVLLAASLAGMVFRREERDPLRVPDPEPGGSRVCGASTARFGREAMLFAPEGDAPAPGGGGDPQPDPNKPKTDDQPAKQFSQADVDRIVTDRVKKTNQQLEELTGKLKDFDAMKARLDEADGLAAKAREEEALKGKSAVEKAEFHLAKAQEKNKELETNHAREIAKLNGELEAERRGRVEDAKRTTVTQALAAGAADGMATYAVNAFLSEVQIEMNENREIVRYTFEGESFDKASDAATAFYKKRKGFARPPEGGGGTPRGLSPSFGATSLEGSGESLLSQGHAERGGARAH